MSEETKNNEGPACACGRGDLYDEWLKQNEKEKEKVEVPPTTSQAYNNSSNDSHANPDQKSEQTSR